MKLVWASDAWEDYLYWQGADSKILGVINDLIKDAQRNPFKGIGKPEPLKHDLAGWWSRRITSDHRLVYRMSGKDQAQQLEILQCRYHYR
jgi:toxin YoeB